MNLLMKGAALAPPFSCTTKYSSDVYSPRPPDIRVRLLPTKPPVHFTTEQPGRDKIPETAYPLKKVIGANDKVSSCYISSRHIARMLNKTEQRTCHLELYKCSNSVLAVMEAV